MIPLSKIYDQVLMEFAEALKERCGVDTSFVGSETIDEFVRQIKSNLKNTQDLFNQYRIVEEQRMPTVQLPESSDSSQQSEDQEQSEQQAEREERKVDGFSQVKKQKHIEVSNCKQLKLQKKKKQKQWDEEYKNQNELTDKVRSESRKAADCHIAAVYNLKTKKYIAAKNQEQIGLNLAIIKSGSQQTLVTGLHGRLNKGDKRKVLSMCLKKQEISNKECSYEQKLVLLKQMLN